MVHGKGRLPELTLVVESPAALQNLQGSQGLMVLSPSKSLVPTTGQMSGMSVQHRTESRTQPDAKC